MERTRDRPVPSARAELVARVHALLEGCEHSCELLGVVVAASYFVLMPISAMLAEAELLFVLVSAPLAGAAPLLLRAAGRRAARRYARSRLGEWMRQAAARHGASLVELEPAVAPELVRLTRPR